MFGTTGRKWKRSVNNRMRDYGVTDDKKRTIQINKKKSKGNPSYTRPVKKGASKYPDVLDTIIHEELHKNHPKMKEPAVRKKARKMVKKLPKKKKRKYYNLYT